MYISSIIEDFLVTVREKLPEFNYLPKDFYDPNLDFDGRIRSYIVKFDAEKTEGSERDWLGICWNRGVIQDAPELQDRAFLAYQTDVTNLYANSFKIKFAKVSFNIAYFSNSLDYMEDFEEAHYLEFNKLFSHKILYPLLGWGDVAYTELALGDITKLERNDKGTIVELSFSFSAIFPVARPIKGTVPLIGQALDPKTGLPTGKPKINLNVLFEVVDTPPTN